jgi:predicted DNA-binding transcriptional regulator AlpA
MSTASNRQENVAPLVRAREVARMLGWSEWCVLQAARRGTLPCRRDGRSVWFSRVELERWIAGEDRA